MATDPSPASTGFYRPTEFEMAVSWVHGLLPPQPIEAPAVDPVKVLAGMLAPLLETPPCYVAFSGGRDSSAVLALATATARTEGLEDPIPVTERYPGLAEADESDWQQQVVDHLHLKEWSRLDLTGQTDLVGPVAAASLTDHGLLWPPAVHVKPAILRHLDGGSLLTGEGGDEVLGPRRVAPWHHLSRRMPTSRRAALVGAASTLLPAPIRVRRAKAALHRDQDQPWVKPDAADRHLRLLATDLASEPLRWDQSLRWLTQRRSAAVGATNYRLLAAEYGVTVMDPLLEPTFLAALGRQKGALGFSSRTEAMRELFGDVLPKAVIERHSKARFNRAYMGEAARSFAREWDGTGVPAGLVDTERLRAEWLSEDPAGPSGTLLQAAWLATNEARA